MQQPEYDVLYIGDRRLAGGPVSAEYFSLSPCNMSNITAVYMLAVYGAVSSVLWTFLSISESPAFLFAVRANKMLVIAIVCARFL